MSTTATTIDPEQRMLGEVEMVGRDRWEEIHRRARAGGSIRTIARELELDRKTVRRCLRQTEWKPYRRAARADTLLASDASICGGGRRRWGYPARRSHPQGVRRQPHPPRRRHPADPGQQLRRRPRCWRPARTSARGTSTVGAIPAKVLAAHRGGSIRVVLPPGNSPQIEEDLGDDLCRVVAVHYVTHIDELLDLALQPAPRAAGDVVATITP